MFFTILLFSKTYNISEFDLANMLPCFGLIQGANFQMTFSNSTTENYFIALLDSQEYSRIPHLSISYASSFCSRIKTHFARINATVVSHIHEAKFQVIIPEKDLYIPLIVACQTTSSQYCVHVHFTNSNSLLDSRRLPSFIAMPIEVAVIAACFFPWIVNQFQYREHLLSFHKFITVAIVFTFINILFNYAVLWNDNFQDKTNFCHFFQTLTNILCEIFIFSTIILASKGWCIIFQSLQSLDINEVIVYSSLYIMLRTLSSNVSFTVFSIVFFAATTMLLLILFSSLRRGINLVEKHILAHMYIIYQKGINPMTTPIHRQYLIYTHFKHILVIYFSICIAKMSYELVDSTVYWLQDIFNVSVRILILCALAALFHVRKEDWIVYTNFDAKKATEMSAELADEICIDMFNNDDELVEWNAGMELPPQPIISKEKEEKDETFLEDTSHVSI